MVSSLSLAFLQDCCSLEDLSFDRTLRVATEAWATLCAAPSSSDAMYVVIVGPAANSARYLYLIVAT